MMNYPQNPYLGQIRPTYPDLLAQSLQMQQQQSQYFGIKGRPVASYDEAKASMIDFDGSVFYFPDTANKRIYTKQINLDGTSSLRTYALVENPIPQQSSPTPIPLNQNYVSKEEFSSTINKLMEDIQSLRGVKPNANDEHATANDESFKF